MNVARLGDLQSTALAPRRTPAYEPYGVRDLLTAIFYHRRGMVIAFFLPCLLAVAIGLRVHPVYVSQARLLVLNGSDYVFHPTPGQGGSDLALDRNQIMQGELQILQSSSLAADVLQKVGVTRVYPTVDENDPIQVGRAVSRFGNDLAVSAVPLSSVIELSFANRDRMIAAEVLKVLISNYFRRRAAVFENSPADNMNLQRSRFADQLHQAEDELAAFGKAHGISNIDEQVTILLHQAADNLSLAHQTDQDIKQVGARLAALREQLRTVPQTVQTFAETNRTRQNEDLTDNLVTLQSKQRDLRSRYHDDFPLLADITHQIEDLQRQIAAVPARDPQITRDGRNLVYDDLRGQEITLATTLAGLEAKRGELGSAAAALQQRLDELTLAGQRYRDLLRSRDVLDESYRAIERNSVEAQQAAALERLKSPNVRVVQAPEPPSTGRNPQPIIWLGGAVMGVVAAGFVLALGIALRQVLVTVHDAETALELPVLATAQFQRRRRMVTRESVAL